MSNNQKKEGERSHFPQAAISLPKGGGAIRGIGEKFAANPVTGTGSMTVPIATSPGRSGFGPQLSLSYDSGAGNGPFGFGWSLMLPSITRKTDKGLPKYEDTDESDVFILSGAEDLVPALIQDGGEWRRDTDEKTAGSKTYSIQRYRPRIEGLFARIERWTSRDDPKDSFWRSMSKENITTWYGKTAESRIADPDDPARIFSWLICKSYDDKGNAIVYKYKEENSDGIVLSQTHEANRTPSSRSANRYLKRIRYGNRTPYFPKSVWDQPPAGPAEWLFDVVLDYGEHDLDAPAPDDALPWTRRNDPFSSYRAGFEVRTYRLCQRVLMFHRFSELGGTSCLVRSTDFTYSYEENPSDARNPIFSFLLSVTQSGYKRQNGSYLKKSLPPLGFEYSKAVIEERVREIDAESLENLPYGLDGGQYQWVDLDGEGLSGILTEQAEGWFYKRNLSPTNVKQENGKETMVARFAPVELAARKPSLTNIKGGQQQFLDLAGDGQLDLVDLEGPTPGFYERTYDGGWKSFAPFPSLPVLDWDNPNLKFVDLTGDGHADILIAGDDAFTWHPSLAEAGFGPPERVPNALDEEKGPRLVFADGAQSIYLSDMSGDGLADLVRIGNGEVCYWPNLGYGRFGAKVTMDNGPWFDAPDQFNQQRIRLADIDGSGVTDIIYLGRDDVHLYFNQSGNSWSKANKLAVFSQTDNLSSVMALDFLGNGTACLVWSSPLPGDMRRPMRYLALMEEKPHLLTEVKNNLGAETHVYYAPSTKFYLSDKMEGKPWITRLPFPVHVVERVETYDRISRNRFVTRYTYHHGYFDGVEREFRGFGLVEQWDTEEIGTVGPEVTGSENMNWDATSFVPPVLTKTWFHTGAFFEDGRISNQFEDEYYHEGDPSIGEGELTEDQLQAMLLPDTVLPDGLTAEESHEACRSLKGVILRQEIYARDRLPDGTLSEESNRPCSVSERDYTIKRLQPRGDNNHAVFFTHARETVDFYYEHKLYEIVVAGQSQKRADPRVTQSVTLAVDDYGNVLKAVSIGYGRRFDDPDPVLTAEDRDKQTKTLLTLTENRYTNPVLLDDAYRSPLPCESQTYELINTQPDAALPQVTNLFRFDEIRTKAEAAGDGSHELPYEDVDHIGAAEDHPYRRLIEHVRTRYRPDDLEVDEGNPLALLPLGENQSLALPGESYKLAFTQGLLAQIYRRNGENLLANPANVLGGKGGDGGGYIDMDGNGHWWIPSGRVFYDSSRNITAQEELAEARQHFFLPRRFRDPFDNETTVTYDSHDLLLVSTTDALNNTVQASNDYRVLQPALIADTNRNRSAATFDALGLVVATAVRGKESESVGDSLEDFTDDDANPSLASLQSFVADPYEQAVRLLRSATTRIVYDLDRYQRCGQPPFAAVLAREAHVSDLAANEQSRIQVSFVHSDGFGREVQTKVQAESGDAPWREPALVPVWRGDPPVETGDVEPGPLVFGNGEPQTRPTDHRWAGTGRTVYNNKGKPVKKYEPFFSSTHLYEPEPEMADTGVTPVLFYDPVERVVATLYPNNTYDKVVFDPWRQATYDVNDTITSDPRTDGDIRGYTDKYFAAQPGNWQTWRALRIEGQAGSEEQAAATKAGVHADTQTVAFFDTLGRPFLSVAHNRFEQNGATVEEKYATRIHLDIEGNQRAVIDARGLMVMRYDYDMLGTRVYQNSMDAGERWMLNNVAGQPIRAWDSREHTIRTTYDELQRPTHLFVRRGNGVEVLVEHTVYGEAHPDAAALNLRGKPYQQYDGAGVVTYEAYDFKGNLLRSSRQLAVEYKNTLDWSVAVALEDQGFASSTTFDALNRPVTLTTPDNSIIRPEFNEANLLNAVRANLRGTDLETEFVRNIDYNAKGQRELIEYCIKDENGEPNVVRTEYEYNKLTFRLKRLMTTRATDNALLQDLSYTYDPVGNITAIRDEAQQTIFFDNEVVSSDTQYVYDALYRLIRADGREHAGQLANVQRDHTDLPHMPLPHPNDPQAMRNYTERYDYDEVGNILRMIHQANNGNRTRRYAYAPDSNRLLTTSLPGDDPLGPYTAEYHYDEHGNMTDMPHLPLMRWDYRDQLQATSQQVVNNGGTPEITYYIYDAAGQRVRKVTEGYADPGQTPTRKEERIYLGGFEIYRKYNGNGSTVILEREILHVMDDKQRIALVETKTVDTDVPPFTPTPLTRYQFGNHLGSASLELDESGEIISYEEYYPYGSTSYQAVRSQTETPKHYRYTGKERDEESGLYYHGARYYAPWLGRWTSCDPTGIVDGAALYTNVRDNPIRFSDPSGTQTVDEVVSRARESLRDAERTLERLNALRARLGTAAREYTEALPSYLAAARRGDVAETTRLGEIVGRSQRVLRSGGAELESIATSVSQQSRIFDLSGELDIALDPTLNSTLTSEQWERFKLGGEAQRIETALYEAETQLRTAQDVLPELQAQRASAAGLAQDFQPLGEAGEQLAASAMRSRPPGSGTPPASSSPPDAPHNTPPHGTGQTGSTATGGGTSLSRGGGSSRTRKVMSSLVRGVRGGGRIVLEAAGPVGTAADVIDVATAPNLEQAGVRATGAVFWFTVFALSPPVGAFLYIMTDTSWGM